MVKKEPKRLKNSPDGCDYPFVLGFRTKDSGIQQEFHLKKGLCLASEN